MIATPPDVTLYIVLAYSAAALPLFGLLGWTWRGRQRLARSLNAP
jgi:heme exporter protein CcmD